MYSVEQMYRATPRQLRLILPDVLQAGKVPYIASSPGEGKSSLVRALFKQFNLYMIDHRLSTSQPEDIGGYPFFPEGSRKAQFRPFDIFPLEGDPIPDGYAGFGLFFDEFSHASFETQNATYKVLLDKMFGQYKAHPLTAMVCAGNMSTDKANVNKLSSALQSRVISYHMQLNFDEFMEDVAIPQNWDPRVLSYLGFNKMKELSNFNPDLVDSQNSYNCPRTWDDLQQIIKGKEVTDYHLPTYAGCISTGSAVSFVQWCKVMAQLDILPAILNDWATAPIPVETEQRWMLTQKLITEVTLKNYAAIGNYVDRLPFELKTIFYRTVLLQKPEIRSHSDFPRLAIQVLTKLAKSATMQPLTKGYA